MGFLNSGLLRAAAQAIQGGVKGDREGKAAARKQQAAEEDRRQRLEEDALRRSMLEFNFGQAQSGAQAGAAAGQREATELAALRGQDPTFANLSRDAIERQLQDRAKPHKAEAPTVIPGSAEDLRIRQAQAAATGKGATEAMDERQTGAMKQKIAANRTQLGNIDRAIQKLDKYPAGVGLSNYLPDAVKQRTDPEGVDVRSEIANIGSVIFHDRSGAAITVSESKRLQPFIPSATDSPGTIRTKLGNLRRAIMEETGYLDPKTPQTGPSEAGRAAARAAMQGRK